jgi:hypothetical protein
MYRVQNRRFSGQTVGWNDQKTTWDADGVAVVTEEERRFWLPHKGTEDLGPIEAPEALPAKPEPTAAPASSPVEKKPQDAQRPVKTAVAPKPVIPANPKDRRKG